MKSKSRNGTDRVNPSNPVSFKASEKKRELLRKEILALKEKYGLTSDELAQVFQEELLVPFAVFSEKLTVLESVVKYLKENEGLNLRQIASALSRDERNIWHIYNKCKTKQPRKFVLKNLQLRVPVAIFQNTKLSAQESLVSFLRDEEHLSYDEIAKLLRRSASTIRTVYQRSRQKYVK